MMKNFDFDKLIHTIHWKKRVRQFYRLSNRMRLVIFVVPMIVILVLWYLVLALPLQWKYRTVEKQKAVLVKQIHELNQKALAITDDSNQDDPKAVEQRQKLQAKIDRLNKNLALFSDDEVFPDKIDVVLEDLLHNNGQLTLVNFSSDPPKKLSGSDAKGRELYLHNITLTLRGNYFDTLSYLQSIEKIRWRIFWDSLNYRVATYPLANIIVKIHTISSSTGTGEDAS